MSRPLINRIATVLRIGLFFACLLGAWDEAFSQPGPVFIGGINGFIPNSGRSRPAPQPAPLDPAVGDVVRFLDGSELHGELRSIAPGQGVRWHHPGAKKEIEFLSGNISSIHFASSAPAARGTNAGALSKPACQVRLANGDVFFGGLSAMDGEGLSLSTSFAGDAKIPRAAVQSISFLPRDFAVVYDGPLTAQEWQISPPTSWSFRDGVFVSSGAGALSSDFNVPGSVTLEFDVAWDSVYALMVSVYSGQRQDSEGFNAYLFTFSASSVDVRRQSPTTMSVLGRADLPPPAQKGKYRFTIQCNRTDGSFAVFADHQLVKRWKDTQGFFRDGPRIFFTDMSGRTGVRLSNIRLMSWQDVEPELTFSTQTNLDAVSLVNRDTALGTITGIEGGNLKLLLGTRALTVPLARVTRIDFSTNAAPVPAESQDVRAWLTGGGRVSFQLERWEKDKIAAHSALFGDFILQPQSIRELEFNLGRPKSEPAAASSPDLGGLDD